MKTHQGTDQFHPSASQAVRTWWDLWRSLNQTSHRSLGVALIATIVGSVATVGIPLIVSRFVDAVYHDGTIAGLHDVIAPLSFLVAAYVVTAAADVVRHQTIHTVTTDFESSARGRMYASLIRWDLGRFRSGSDGRIYGRANRSVEGAERLIKLGASDLIPAVLVSIFAVAVALVHYRFIGLVMTIVIPTGFALVVWQVRNQNGIRLNLKDAKERIDGSVMAWLSMIKVIRTTGTERYFDERIGRECTDLRETELRHHMAMSRFDAMKALNEALWLIVSLVLAIELQTTSSPGELAGLVLMYLAITKPLRDLHRVIDESSEASLQAKDLVTDLAIPFDESFAGPQHASSESRRSLHAAPPAISLTGVTFSHGEDSRFVLRGISAEILAGERVGLVGTSGCGKSTLLDLIARLNHGYVGSARLIGREVREIGRDELVGMLGYVSQEPTLFPGTIRDNLTLGRRGITDDDLDFACTQANIQCDIHTLAYGYDTLVTQRGSNLSGGQRQRLCIARALLMTPRILLLDEPTSALDAVSQEVVQTAIDALEDVTMLMVAHRLSTLKHMDRIIVMDAGRIIEEGTFADLEATDGHFARMLESERLTA